MKTLTIRQVAAIKRIAQNVNPLVVKKNKIAAKIDELNKEYNALIDEIEGHEMGVKSLTGGYVSEDLLARKVEDTGKTDKEGKPIKVTKYEPREDVLVFNEASGVYEIKEPEIDAPVEVVTVDGTESVSMVESTEDFTDNNEMPFYN